MFSFETKGSFKNTEAFFDRMLRDDIFRKLEKYGQEGVDALSAATPVDSGETASSWSYEIIKDSKTWSIVWSNDHMAGDTPVVVLLQHGHGLRDGSFFQGEDFINPALKPIFDRIADEAWKEVTK